MSCASLLLLCVAVAAHSALACYVVEEGNISDGTPHDIELSLQPYQYESSVQILPPVIFGGQVSGLKLSVCTRFGSKADAKLRFHNNAVYAERIPGDDYDKVNLRGTGFVTPAGLAHQDIRPLDNGPLS